MYVCMYVHAHFKKLFNGINYLCGLPYVELYMKNVVGCTIS